LRRLKRSFGSRAHVPGGLPASDHGSLEQLRHSVPAARVIAPNVAPPSVLPSAAFAWCIEAPPSPWSPSSSCDSSSVNDDVSSVTVKMEPSSNNNHGFDMAFQAPVSPSSPQSSVPEEFDHGNADMHFHIQPVAIMKPAVAPQPVKALPVVDMVDAAPVKVERRGGAANGGKRCKLFSKAPLKPGEIPASKKRKPWKPKPLPDGTIPKRKRAPRGKKALALAAAAAAQATVVASTTNVASVIDVAQAAVAYAANVHVTPRVTVAAVAVAGAVGRR
jgi:hypothetical protein